MLYSVWNTGARRYDYYQAVGSLRDGVFAPKASLPSGGKLGVAADRAGRPLPGGAKLVGHGDHAQGVIATRNPGLALGMVDVGVTGKALLLLGAALLLRKVTK